MVVPAGIYLALLTGKSGRAGVGNSNGNRHRLRGRLHGRAGVLRIPRQTASGHAAVAFAIADDIGASHHRHRSYANGLSTLLACHRPVWIPGGLRGSTGLGVRRFGMYYVLCLPWPSGLNFPRVRHSCHDRRREVLGLMTPGSAAALMKRERIDHFGTLRRRSSKNWTGEPNRIAWSGFAAIKAGQPGARFAA